MHVIYKGRAFTIDHDASDLKEAFAFLGSCEEMFGSAETCENCQGTDLRLKYRTTKGGYEFFSIECHNCKWEFKFGQRKEGGLYPKAWEPPYESIQVQPANTTKQELKSQSPF